VFILSVVEKIKSDIAQPEKKKNIQTQKMGLLVENSFYKQFKYPW